MSQKPIHGFDGPIDEQVRHGWRTYSVTREFALEGGYGVVWEGPEHLAQCGKGFDDKARAAEAHEACVKHVKAGECSCGIYAYKEPPEPPGQVMVDVVLWGLVEHGDRGARSTHARIEAIFVKPPVCAWHGMVKDEDGPAHECQGTTLWALNPDKWRQWFPACEAILKEIQENISDITIGTLSMEDFIARLIERYKCPVIVGWPEPRQVAAGWFEGKREAPGA